VCLCVKETEGGGVERKLTLAGCLNNMYVCISQYLKRNKMVWGDQFGIISNQNLNIRKISGVGN
jgi:hypothetical protein